MKSLHISSLLTAVLICGCAQQGYQTAEKANDSLTDTKTELIADKAQLKTTVDALNDLVYHPQTDMRPQYMTFSKAVDDLEKESNATKKSTNEMVDQRSAYMAQWRNDTLNNPDADLRDRALKRIDETQKRYDKVNEAIITANASFDPLLTDLEAIRTYIGSDLTSNGIQSVSDRATTARNRSITVGQDIDAAVNEIDGANAESTPITTQPGAAQHDMNKM